MFFALPKNRMQKEIAVCPCWEALRKRERVLNAEETSNKNTLKSASTVDKQTAEPNADKKK